MLQRAIERANERLAAARRDPVQEGVTNHSTDRPVLKPEVGFEPTATCLQGRRSDH